MAANTDNVYMTAWMKFVDLSAQLLSLRLDNSEKNRQYVNTLLDGLNAIDYQVPQTIRVDNAVRTIETICLIVKPGDTFLVAKGCQLMIKLVKQHQIKIEGKPLHSTISWCIQGLKNCEDIAILDILSALDVLMRGNASSVEDPSELFGEIGILTSMLDPVTFKMKFAAFPEVQLLAIRCVESLATLTSESSSSGNKCLLSFCYPIFLQQLNTEVPSSRDELNSYKIITSSLKGLQCVIYQSKDIIHGQLGDIIGIIQTYMVFGLPDYTHVKPQRVYPTPLALADVKPSGKTGRGAKCVRVRHKRSTKPSDNSEEPVGCYYQAPSTYESQTGAEAVAPAPWLKMSDSEYSDTDVAGAAAKNMWVEQRRVRCAALYLLYTVVKVTDKKVLFGYWTTLLPDSSNSVNSRTLLACLCKDRSARSRMEVLSVLIAMLMGSRNYLSQAENSEKHMPAFTPYSLILGDMVRELHRSLCMTLSEETTTNPVVVQLLRCIALLVQNTTYQRLTPGLLTELVTKVKPFVKRKDWTVQVASLTVLGTVVSIDPPIPEVLDILTYKCRIMSNNSSFMEVQESEEFEADSELEVSFDNEAEASLEEVVENQTDIVDSSEVQCETVCQMSWLLETCLKHLGVFTQMWITYPATVKVETLQILTALVKNYFSEVISGHTNHIVSALKIGLFDSDVTICLHSGKVVEAIGYAMQKHVQEGEEPIMPTSEISYFWNAIISGNLITLLASAKEALRSIGCDCLATIGHKAFDQIEHGMQITIITMLIGSCGDIEAVVRSSAIRAVGIYVLFPVLREDIYFITDAMEHVNRLLQDEWLPVRVSAAWALGNLSDAMVLNLTEEKEHLPRVLLLEVLNTSLKVVHGREKCRASVVRAFGGLLRLITKDVWERLPARETINKIIDVLITYATSGRNMKVRWNCCYSLGKMMHNDVLYMEGMIWPNSVFPALMDLVENFTNFKVRISAAVALAVPNDRKKYGNHYRDIWTALLNALDNSYAMADYNEYVHQDNLVDQICLTLCHLTNIITKDDLEVIQDVVTYYLETLPQHLRKFHERLVPEKADVLIAATNHLTSLLQLPGLTSEQHSGAGILTSIFIQDDSTFMYGIAGTSAFFPAN